MEDDNDALFRRTLTAAAAAGFFLVLGVGASVTSHLLLPRSSALAFVGLLAPFRGGVLPWGE